MNSPLRPKSSCLIRRVAGAVLGISMLVTTAAFAAPRTQIQLFQTPDVVCDGELIDVQVRIKFHQDVPLVVDEVAILGEGGVILGEVTSPTFARRNDHWYYFTFYGVSLSDSDANGDGSASLVAIAAVRGDGDIISQARETFIGPPETPLAPHPAHGSTVLTVPLVLDWGDVPGASSYNVYLNGGRVAANLYASSWTINVPLGASGTHTWRVEAVNHCGSTFGPLWRFIVQCTAPGVPSGPSPANNATLTSSPTVLNWGDTPGATSYDVVVDGATFASGLTVSQVACGAMTAGSHTWYVIARNACGATTGPLWRFNIAGCTLPAVPAGPNPSNSLAAINAPVLLNWADTARATAYDVYLNGAVVAVDLFESQWFVDVIIPTGTNTWYVIARNECGETRGPNWRFVVQGCLAPATPATPNPANGVTLTAAPTLLNWADTARATAYDVYLNGDLVAFDLFESQWHVDVAIPSSTNTWYVVARNECDETRGPNWRFVVQGCIAPATPAGPNPSNSLAVVSAPAVLNWADAARATAYDVYLNGALVAFDLPQSQWLVDVVIPFGTNTWYVIARNDCGETRGPNWRFVVQDCSAPGTPATPSPANGVTFAIAPTILNWTDTARATAYDVYLNGDLVAFDLYESQWVVDVAIPSGTNLWYVVARNACDETRGPNWRFTVQACLPPAIPATPTPVNGATLSTAPLVLNWADTPRATSYDVILDGDLVASGLTASQWSCDVAIGSGLHTWSVIAYNECGITAGPIWAFTVACLRPAVPTTPAPIHNATLQSSPSRLDWADALRATSYDLVVDGTLVAQGLTTSDWACGGLAVGPHSWYVIARNACGVSTGAVWRFTIACALPAAPAAPTPANGALLNSAPTKLNWSDCARATTYDVYLNGALVASNLGISEWTIDRSLRRSSHTWSVVARNACGSTRGPQWSFTLRRATTDD